ncbi:enoyl-CoA hydratase/isomerase family protein [Bradyrhizobium sp. Leo170]|uniref:enoyl-CoA hydratase/isomerase family protein n=1 Tax=Bradyrhizobium sp. Leo170 TaxID=1571199 RepID=UPI001FE21B37|nr:enoyl-CoA hydratase/isomerase family protein [Bradyrhizobium sp. Leo170]
MIDKGPVLLDISDGIARLRLNRPDAANGMSAELLSALGDAIMVCHGHPDLRVVLLSGEGTNFCAGGDVRAFASKGEKLPDYIRQATAYLQNAVTGLLRLEAPVIASVQGFAAGGGGFGLVCASDIVIAAESAKFLAGATRVAMAPDAGVSVTLSRLVGLRRAMSILLTNPVISAQAYVKHVLLESYLERLVHKVASRYDHVAYVDGFAGPWQSANERFEEAPADRRSWIKGDLKPSRRSGPPSPSTAASSSISRVAVTIMVAQHAVRLNSFSSVLN